MSIEKALKEHTAALNRFCDLCEKHGINITAQQVSYAAPQVTEIASQVSEEPTATAPVAPETSETSTDTIEDLVIVADMPADEVEEDSDVAEAPAVEAPTADTPVTIDDLKQCISQLLPDKKKIVAVLDKLGVSRITELKAEDLPKAKQLFDQAIADNA